MTWSAEPAGPGVPDAVIGFQPSMPLTNEVVVKGDTIARMAGPDFSAVAVADGRGSTFCAGAGTTAGAGAGAVAAGEGVEAGSAMEAHGRGSPYREPGTFTLAW